MPTDKLLRMVESNDTSTHFVASASGVVRVITRLTPLADATKCVLVSFDLTMRSNLSVGMPIDLICYERDSLQVHRRRRFDEGDGYFTALSHDWSEGTRQVFRQLPELRW